MLKEIQNLYSYHSRFTTRFAEHDVCNVYEKAVRDLRKYGLNNFRGIRILDLGCGQRYPFALQCASNNAKVTALDINYIKPEYLPLAFFRIMKHNGIKRAIKSVVRHVFWDNHYYRALEISASKPLRKYRTSIDFIVSDPTSTSYPLPSDSFDLIASNAVLEHVANLTEFAREVLRLLDSNGYFYAIIHNFYSISGGHNTEWAFPDEYPSNKVPPWDHLHENRFPGWTYLNRYRPEQYMEAFAENLQVLHFEGVGINHNEGELEGERFLTAEIANELKSFPKDLLLTRSWCLICKKMD